jgi:hypothetical protein
MQLFELGSHGFCDGGSAGFLLHVIFVAAQHVFVAGCSITIGNVASSVMYTSRKPNNM